jgi:amino acid transporter
VWSSLLALSGTYEQLFTYVVFTSVLFSLFGGLALFRLRRTRPGALRPYRVWGYPVVPALFMLGSVFVIYNTLKQRPFESFAGLGLLVLGLPVYAYWKGSKSPEGRHPLSVRARWAGTTARCSLEQATRLRLSRGAPTSRRSRSTAFASSRRPSVISRRT